MNISKRFLLLYLLACLYGVSMFDLAGYQAAIIFLLLGSALVVIARRKGNLLSPVLFIIVAYSVAYPVPILFPSLYPTLLHEVSSHALDHGILWATRGFGAFALGYTLIDLIKNSSRNRIRNGEVFYRDRLSYTVYVFTSIGWISILAWILFTIFFGISLTFIEGDEARAGSAAGSVQEMLELLSGLRRFFFVGFFVLYFWKIIDRHLIWLFIVQVFFAVIEIIIIGSKGSIIINVLVILLSLSLLPLKLSLRQIFIGFSALIVVYGSFGIITEYRSIMLAEHHAGRNILDFAIQAESFRKAVILSLPFSDSVSERLTEISKEDVFKRLGDGIYSFSNLMEFTGREPPYENAFQSFLVPIYSISPRALIPEKPEFFHSGRNAREYYNWTYGGISVTLFGSLYFAWGYLGIVIGMSLLGGLLAYIARQAILLDIYAPHWLILLPFMILSLMDVSIIFQAVITNFIRIALVLWFIRLLYPFLHKSIERRMFLIIDDMRSGDIHKPAI